MAARLNKLHTDEIRARRFYVYELFSGDSIEYVGKGSGRRLETQMRRYGLCGRVVRHFASEAAAYRFEVKHIADAKPKLNRCAGGNGCRANVVRRVRDPIYALCESLGSRVVAARLALNFPSLCDPSKLDEIRRVAYG